MNQSAWFPDRPTGLFESCWLHLETAKARHRQMISLWNRFLDDDPYDSTVTVDDEGVATLSVEALAPPPPELPILLGEFLYHLRTALDHAVYDTAVHDSGQNPPRGANRLQFPITDSETSFHQSAHRIEPLSESHRQWIERMQPYQDEDRPESTIPHWLNDLARKDRYRDLQFVGAFLTESNPEIQVPEGVRIERQTLPGPSVSLLHQQAVVARWQLHPHSKAIGAAVRASPNVAIDPEIRELAIGRQPHDDWPWWPLAKRLESMVFAVEVIVAYLERDCTGATRSAIIRPASEVELPPGSTTPRP